MNSGLNLGKIISGISSIMDYYKKITPIYKDIKPMINKLLEFKDKLFFNKQIDIKSVSTNKEDIKKVVQSTTLPQFYL